jgi:hypothetical protein
MDKLEKLLEIEGFSFDRFLEEFGHESLCPGICMNDGCNYTTDYEPDQEEGWCEVCETNTVKSGLMHMGIY